MSDRFYVPAPPPAGEFVLTGPEAHHLAAVRRFAPGDRVVLFTGDGNEYPAAVLSVGKKQVALSVFAGVPVDREVGFRLEVAAALPKGDRGDFLVEKLTELGVTRFVPLVTARAVVRPGASRVAALRRAVIEASKQCGRNLMMRVEEPAAWEAVVKAGDLPGRRLILHPGAKYLTPQPPSLREKGEKDQGVIVAVGPEGGFTDDEVAAAVAAGWERVSLGPRVLRVETAAVAAAALLGERGT
jgi:16S rRNA (uracil1498-N3)-methyltransferase